MHQKTHIIVELFAQFSRSPASPVFQPSHMGKCMLKLYFKIDQNPYFQRNINIWPAIWDGWKTGEARIAQTIRSKSTRAPNQNWVQFRKPCAPQRRIFKLSSWIRAGGPQLWRAVRARARARALSTREFLQNSHFLLYNFQNNQGKSCSAPRVWQLCKSSAQSEPISKSYDQNKFPLFSYLKIDQK